MGTAPKIDLLTKGITDLDSISEDIWGLGKIPISDFDLVLDIGSGDGVFAKLTSRYHTNANIVKIDWRDKCGGDDVIPVHVGSKEGVETVIVTRAGAVFADIFGREIAEIIATEEVTAMTMEEVLNTYTAEVPNNRIVLKVCDVFLDHLMEQLPYFHNVKALIIITPTQRTEEAKLFIDGLKQIFEIVEDKSSGDVLYVRCYHLFGQDVGAIPKQLGCPQDSCSGDNNNNVEAPKED